MNGLINGIVGGIVNGRVDTLGSLLNYEPEYMAVYNAMPTKPDSTDKSIQNQVVKNLKDLNVWNKALLIDIFCVHAADSALINWKSPGTFNPSKLNNPIFTQYEGWTGVNSTVSLIKLNFNPAANHSGIITKDSITVVCGIGNDIDSPVSPIGTQDGTSRIVLNPKSSNAWNSSCNDNNAFGGAQTVGAGHFALMRNESARYHRYVNKTKSSPAIASIALPNETMYACGRKATGFADVASNHQLRYVMIFSALTDTEIYAVMDIMEESYA